MRNDNGPYYNKRRKGPAIGGYKDSTDVYSQGKRKRDEAMIHSNSKRPKLAEPAGRRYS